jgi:anti-sigma factor RsiW
MNCCEAWSDDIDLYALGALARDEAISVERHVAACSRCSANLCAAKELAALLALSVPVLHAPIKMRDAVFRRARGTH